MARTNKKYLEYFFVGSGDQNLLLTGNFIGTDASTNLADGQLAVICADPSLAHLNYGDVLNTTNDVAGSAANTAAEVPVIRIVQGTPAAANNSAAYGWHQGPNDKGWV